MSMQFITSKKTHQNKTVILLHEWACAHTKTHGVRTPLSGAVRPLRSEPFHSGGLGISSINRAAGPLSSLLLELILAQWAGRLPFYI